MLKDLAFKSKDSMRLNYVQLIMYALLPPMIFGFSYLFWYGYGCCRKIASKEKRDKAFATSVIVLFLFYPTIVSVIAQSMNCQKIDGVYRLANDLEQVCYEGTHLTMMIFVSVPGLIAWAVGIPIFALLQLNNSMAEIRKMEIHSAGKSHDDLKRSIAIRLGFLKAGYEDKYYYWEIVLLMRKTSIVLFIVFLSSVSSGIQSLVSIAIMSAFYII